MIEFVLLLCALAIVRGIKRISESITIVYSK